MSLITIPTDVLKIIFSLLSIEEIDQLRQVCKTLKEFVSSVPVRPCTVEIITNDYLNQTYSTLYEECKIKKQIIKLERDKIEKAFRANLSGVLFTVYPTNKSRPKQAINFITSIRIVLTNNMLLRHFPEFAFTFLWDKFLQQHKASLKYIKSAHFWLQPKRTIYRFEFPNVQLFLSKAHSDLPNLTRIRYEGFSNINSFPDSAEYITVSHIRSLPTLPPSLRELVCSSSVVVQPSQSLTKLTLEAGVTDRNIKIIQQIKTLKYLSLRITKDMNLNFPDLLEFDVNVTDVKEVKIQCAKLEKLWLNIWQPYGAGNYSFDCPNAQLLKFCVYNWKNPLTVTINVKSLESAIIAFSEEPKTVHLNVREPIKILNTVLKDKMHFNSQITKKLSAPYSFLCKYGVETFFTQYGKSITELNIIDKPKINELYPFFSQLSYLRLENCSEVSFSDLALWPQCNNLKTLQLVCLPEGTLYQHLWKACPNLERLLIAGSKFSNLSELFEYLPKLSHLLLSVNLKIEEKHLEVVKGKNHPLQVLNVASHYNQKSELQSLLYRYFPHFKKLVC